MIMNFFIVFFMIAFSLLTIFFWREKGADETERRIVAECRYVFTGMWFLLMLAGFSDQGLRDFFALLVNNIV